jgi:hypothetical protein
MDITDLLARMGGFKKQAQAQPTGLDGLGGLLGGLLDRSAAGTRSTGTCTPSGLASMLDLDGDGNPLDDILRMAGKAMK